MYNNCTYITNETKTSVLNHNFLTFMSLIKCIFYVIVGSDFHRIVLEEIKNINNITRPTNILQWNYTKRTATSSKTENRLACCLRFFRTLKKARQQRLFTYLNRTQMSGDQLTAWSRLSANSARNTLTEQRAGVEQTQLLESHWLLASHCSWRTPKCKQLHHQEYIQELWGSRACLVITCRNGTMIKCS